jgi:hypothetical protein
MADARGMEARSGETEGLDPQGDSPVTEGHAPKSGAEGREDVVQRLMSMHNDIVRQFSHALRQRSVEDMERVAKKVDVLSVKFKDALRLALQGADQGEKA